MALAAAARTLSLTWLHPLNWDEIEYFRATQWVGRGLVPYRDFWEHHTPLQWFLFGPITRFIHSPGAAAIIAMRWAQVPLWVVTFVFLFVWMRRAALERTSILIAILLALCSTMFMLAAVEYRVDALGCALYILALVLLLDADRSVWHALAGGAALCLAGFSNIRLGPLLALTALLMRIVRPGERKWGGSRTANGIFVGAIAAFAACSLYFVVTGSAGMAYRQVWAENDLGVRLSQGAQWIFLHRLSVPFGLRPLDDRQPLFDPSAFDLATVLIFILGTIGCARVLVAHRRTPDHLFVLACLQVGNLLFISTMKFIYTYHFEIVVLLMLPFVAREVDRYLAARPRWRIVAAGLLLVSAVNLFASVFRGKEADLAYQDLIMRQVDRQTLPSATVFDGVGWALRRRPAYRYWFLPMLVVSLESRGIFESYTPEQMIADPPGAIITDHNLYKWLLTHPRLAAVATQHYLPVVRNLWLPGMSARLTPVQPEAQFVVPASGAYRVYGSELLSIHPWFQNPVIFGTFESARTPIALQGFPPANRLPLTWSIDGAPMQLAGVLSLRRHQRLRVVSHANVPLGLMIVPAGVRELFEQPPHGVTLDAAAPPVTHVPLFSNLFQ
jgi:hypothetical protein